MLTLAAFFIHFDFYCSADVGVPEQDMATIPFYDVEKTFQLFS